MGPHKPELGLVWIFPWRGTEKIQGVNLNDKYLMKYLPRTQRQVREIDFYIQAQEDSMKVEAEGKT